MSNPASSPKQVSLGAETAGLLIATFQDIYRQEVGAEEDVHRTLPFFASALGFVIAAIEYAVGQLPRLDSLMKGVPSAARQPLNHHVLARMWPVLLAAVLLAIAAALGTAVLGFLAAATRRLSYQRAGPETAQLQRAEALQAYYLQIGLVGEELDRAVSLDLQQQLLRDYAEVIPYNRALTLRRYTYRAYAIVCLLLSLLFALLATMSVLVASKTGLLLGAIK